MRVPAVALGINQSTATAVVYGSGAFGCAVAGLLAVVGHQVKLVGDNTFVPSECDLLTDSRARYTSEISIDAIETLARDSVRSSDLVIIAVPATEYGAVAEDLAAVLSSGQTVFIMGAAFGASLEIAHIIESTRSDLNINLVEVMQPFRRYHVEGRTVKISGMRDTLFLAGRSLNETRAGLQAGSNILNGLVPASNIIDRAFADMDHWLETAALLFNAFDRGTPPGGSDPSVIDCSPTDSANVVVAALRTELEALGRAYGVKRGFEGRVADARSITSPDWRHDVARRVIEDYAILSSLARLAYMPVPMIETVIEIASVLTNTDLRKEARQLTDLGMIGMDAKEIIEHVSA